MAARKKRRKLQGVVNKLRRDDHEIKSAIVVSKEGLLVVHTHYATRPANKISASLTEMVSVARKLCLRIRQKSTVEEICIKNNEYILYVFVADGWLLATKLLPDADLSQFHKLGVQAVADIGQIFNGSGNETS